MFQLEEHPHEQLEVARRSALGLVKVYNLLPQEFVDAESVSLFQGLLQNLVKQRVACCCDDWRET